MNSSDSILGNNNTYTYDNFNRLSALNGGTGGLSLSWVYDRYGNRLQQNASGTGSAPQPNYQVSAANNRITAYTYDAAGEVNYDGSNGYSYDADGNAVNDGATRYNYDALGNRFEKISTTGDPTWYVYDAFGRQLEVVDGTTDTLLETRLTYNGAPLAFYANGSLEFQHTDWLGTVRAISNSAGSFIATYHSLPYGDGYSYSGSDPDTGHFADLERDSSTNTDHAVARNFGEAEGRWMSPDPYDGSYDWGNPQSYNRYAYVMGNPLGLVDPSGQIACEATATVIILTGGPLGPEGSAIACGAEYAAEAAISIFKLLGLFDGPSFHGSLKPRPSGGQPWSEIVLPNNPNIAGALGLPDNTCEFGACGSSFGPGDPSSPNRGVLYTIGSIAELFGTGFAYDDWTDSNHRLFGTHYCGPGGGGSETNQLDHFCHIHDDCYGKFGVDASVNLPSGHSTPLSPWQIAGITGCNQALADGARSVIGTTGAGYIVWWLKLGGGFLYPGTNAH